MRRASKQKQAPAQAPSSPTRPDGVVSKIWPVIVSGGIVGDGCGLDFDVISTSS